MWAILSILLVSHSLFAQESVISFKNDREGNSFYSKHFQDRSFKRDLKRISQVEALELYSLALNKQDAKKICSYNLNSEIQTLLEERSIRLNFSSFIYLLRREDVIDDVAAGILLKAHQVKTTLLHAKSEHEKLSIDGDPELKEKLELVTSFEKRFLKNNCFDEAYRSYYGQLTKIDKKLKSYQIELLHSKALLENRISLETYKSLEQARLNNLENPELSLSSYLQKVQRLRTQYPLRDEKEQSRFVSERVKKFKMSRRQKLFANYTELQIILMGNVIKKLRARLDYDAVEIMGYKDGQLQETIPLDPMERFRFAIKVLRKEMSLLSLNTYFNGRSPDYMDLMTASFEIGVIPASELDSIASLEEIWNPKKSFWDKAGIWVRTFSSVATIVVPPPYGFIPALAIVVIEATTGSKKQNNNQDPSVLF